MNLPEIPHNRKLARNLEIVRAIEQGERYTHVAARYGITRQCVHQIWKRFGPRDLDLPTGRPPKGPLRPPKARERDAAA